MSSSSSPQDTFKTKANSKNRLSVQASTRNLELPLPPLPPNHPTLNENTLKAKARLINIQGALLSLDLAPKSFYLSLAAHHVHLLNPTQNSKNFAGGINSGGFNHYQSVDNVENVDNVESGKEEESIGVFLSDDDVNFYSHAWVYDVSQTRLKRLFNSSCFSSSADSTNGTLNVNELIRALLAENYDFRSKPKVFLELLDRADCKVDRSEGAINSSDDDTTSTNTNEKGEIDESKYSFAFPVYLSIVRKLKLYFLSLSSVVKRLFKRLRMERLMTHSAGIRNLIRLAIMHENKNKEMVLNDDDGEAGKVTAFEIEAKTKTKTLNFNFIPGMVRPLLTSTTAANKPQHQSLVSAQPPIYNITKINANVKRSYELVFQDINSIDDKVEAATVTQLTTAVHDMGVKINVYDYCYDKLATQQSINSDTEKWSSFLTEKQTSSTSSGTDRTSTRPDFAKVQWINVDNFDSRSLLQLSVAFNVPPLATKNILNLWNQQLTVIEISNMMLSILPCIRLSRSSKRSYERYDMWRKKGELLQQAKRLESEGVVHRTSKWLQHILLRTQEQMESLSSPDSDEFFKLEVESSRAVILNTTTFDTILTLSTDWKPRSNYSIDEDIAVGADITAADDEDEDSDDEEVRLQADLKGPFHLQHKFIKHDFSFIRSGDCNWLICSCMRSIIDDVSPVANAYRTKLELMQDNLHNASFTMDSSSKQFLRKIHNIQREVEWMTRKIKPTKRIIQHSLDDGRVGKELTHYFNDLIDNVASVQDELAAILSLISVMKAEFEFLQDRRLNELLSILTFVTVCVLPAQFMTGLFGMNFQDADGNPSPSMLSWRFGYSFFWFLSISSLIGIFYIFRFRLKVM